MRWSGAPYSRRVSAVRLQGRDDEIAGLAAFCAGVAGGPGLLLVEGEPGIGKTSLLRAALAASAPTEYRLLSACPTAAERALPFATLVDLLGVAEDADLAELPPPQRQALSVALLRTSPAEGASEQLAVSLGVVGLLRQWALRGPVLMVVDDAQWVDATSAQVLDFALRRLVDVPFRLLCARRSGMHGQGLDPHGVLPSAEELHLGGLPSVVMQALLAERCGVHPAGPALARLVELTSGNPLHALELARALPPGERIPVLAPLPVRSSLTGLIAQRLADLPPGLDDLLAAAAAATRPTVPLLDAVAHGLDDALASGVLVRDGGGDRVRFSHPLLAAAAYSRVTGEQRRGVHRRLAAVVANPDERVRHLALGAADPDAVLALDLEAAARTTAARGAPAEAAELYEHAARLTPSDEGALGPRRQLAAAAAHDESGDTGRAGQLFAELVDALGPGPLRAAALFGLANLADTLDDALTLLDRAAAEVGGDHDLATRIVLRVHEQHGLLRGLSDADLDPLREAMAGTAAREDWAGWADVACAVVFTELEAGHGVDQDLVDSIEQVYDPWAPPRFRTSSDETVGCTIGLVLNWAGQVDEAARWLSREREALTQTRRLTALGPVFLRSAHVEIGLGDYRAAEDYAARCLELARPAMSDPAAAHYLTALVAAHLGQVEKARTEATLGSAVAQQVHDTTRWCTNEWALAFIDLSLEDFAAAYERLARLLPVAEPMFYEPSSPPIRSDTVECLIALGNLDQAEAVLVRLEERGRELDRLWVHAHGARLRGMLRAARGELATAEQAFEQSLEHHARLRDPLGHGRTWLALGSTLRRARRKADAREALQQASAMFSNLGAELWTLRAERELSRIGLRPAARTGPSGLSAAEQQVAELVVTGMTNRQVAAQLYMSTKTVEAHLSRVYAKLQLRSRTDLARTLRAEA